MSESKPDKPAKAGVHATLSTFREAQPGDPVIVGSVEDQVAVYEIIVAALVRRYGGSVTIEAHELFHPKARAIKWQSHRHPEPHPSGHPNVTLDVTMVETTENQPVGGEGDKPVRGGALN